MHATQLHCPIDRRQRPDCGARGPAYPCNRPAGHGGRHAFTWRHLDGRVRDVWATCQVCGAVTDLDYGPACPRCVEVV